MNFFLKALVSNMMLLPTHLEGGHTDDVILRDTKHLRQKPQLNLNIYCRIQCLTS